ncbi:MAG TPA: DEAD/DEAH box helicase [Bacteroidetes bacterium]|nr:DEAD/DEAH box helicase [Bacteroidota bacterium]
MDIKTFRKRFRGLSAVEQGLLKVLSIAWEPVQHTVLLKILEGCGIRRDSGLPLTEDHLGYYREMLYTGGWLGRSQAGETVISKRNVELTMRMAVVDTKFKLYTRQVQKYLPATSSPQTFARGVRELRLALYEGKAGKVANMVNSLIEKFPAEWGRAGFFQRFFSPFDSGWINTFPIDIQAMALTQLISTAVYALEPVKVYEDFLIQNGWDAKAEKQNFGLPLLEELYLLQGRFKEAAQLAHRMPYSGLQLLRKATAAFFLGDDDLARKAFEGGTRLLRRQGYLPKTGTEADLHGVVHVLAILKEKQQDYLSMAGKLCEGTSHGVYKPLFAYLKGAILYQLNYVADAEAILSTPPLTALEWIFYAACRYWCDLPIGAKAVRKLHRLFHQANENGYYWPAQELATLISKFDPDQNTAKRFEIIASQMAETSGWQGILSVMPKTEKWMRNLEALLQIKPKRVNGKGTKAQKEVRLAWLVNFDRASIQPIEQTRTRNGWSKGRNVSLKRLKEGTMQCLTDQDRLAIAAIENARHGYYSSQELRFNYAKLVQALVGHPLLFLEENRHISVELVAEKPRLMVEEGDDCFEIKFAHPVRKGLVLVRETPTRYLLINYNETHTAVSRLLPEGSLSIPKEAKDKLDRAIAHLSSFITVQSAIGGQAGAVETVEANALPHLHLLPVGQGFKIEFFVKPFTSSPPYFKPGEGHPMVIAEINGITLRTQRNLKLEKKNARYVVDACPTLFRQDSLHFEWHLQDTAECLQVLLELEPLRTAGEVVLEHPKGEKIRISGHLNFDQLSLGIRKKRNWFELDGKVQVNENLVMDFRQLLELTQNSTGNFVEISDGQFLSITSQLRRKLNDLNTIVTKTKQDLRFHPLTAPMLENFTDLVHDLQVDAAWKNQLARLHEAKNLDPKVPPVFKATLRNYQLEGFRWLSQLAYWGVGACLADDMGLGKTIQALAVLLNRANDGPALVVAPASVVRNWYHETKRFAPTLRPLIFGQGDRTEMLDNLQPFDLLLCSYGLMQQESKRFVGKHFTTIVLDEAQAIKNRTTKRSQAAMQLQADFRIITTGTPIENHLGELWNLFNFLNPGLLGSRKRFNDTYALPIERYNDTERRNQLKRLIQPFILRRRKSEVLNELPPKTEVTLTVQLSPEERAFYEALRRKAIENIEAGNGMAADKRFLILAELMRLRQACCHPRMVNPNSKLSSSKLNLLAETVEELIAEGHKILLFSQFVKHLKLVEEWVQSQGITYQYLDGSTPLDQRDKAIRAFQSGQGDLFLISLKAGGFGLNLTAANYVIHLDPWWNPAVEDQASDRAHRIGQQKPVTIYRLVAENTIEEKIVKLHAEKRDLADSLLEGTERSAKLSAEQLLELMKTG